MPLPHSTPISLSIHAQEVIPRSNAPVLCKTSLPVPSVQLGRPLNDLTGKVFTRLTVLKRTLNKSPRHPLYLCQCICGNQKEVLGSGLISGGTQSCGCLNIEQRSKTHTTHGLSKTPEYSAWCDMWKRCTNPKNKRYAQYKDRTPPEGWKDFIVFLAEVGPKPSPKYSLERIDNDKPYGPGNVRWATNIEQSNNRSNNRLVTYLGKTQTLGEWSRETGLSQATLSYRMRVGWSEEDMLTKPARIALF